MVSSGVCEAELGEFRSSSSFLSRREHFKKRRQLIVGGSVGMLVVCVGLVLFITTTHHAYRPQHPVELATSVKVAKAVAAAAKPAAAAAKPAPPESSEERIESALRTNLDRAAKDLQKAQLRPLLISQGRAILHSAKNPRVHTDEDDDDRTLDHHVDLHAALVAEHNHEAAESSSSSSSSNHNDDGVSGVEDRTEQALRHQLDEETKSKEKQMFQNALKEQHAKVVHFGPNGDFKSVGTGKAGTEDDGVSTSTANEEAALRAQLEATTKAKQKKMYQEEFRNWLEKQQQVKYQKAKKQVKLAARESQLFKETLSKAKKEGPTLAAKRAKEREEREAYSGLEGKSKPSFSTWLKAFKRQLAHRTAEANKKIVESRYTHPSTKTGKQSGPSSSSPASPASPPLSPSETLKSAAEKRARAEKAVKDLEKSLKLEQEEEKKIKSDEDSEFSPGKALALLKKTMRKEREALREITKDERGTGADPSLAHLAPKEDEKKQTHNSGILGLDDLDYF